jgi:hypothetical protein
LSAGLILLGALAVPVALGAQGTQGAGTAAAAALSTATGPTGPATGQTLSATLTACHSNPLAANRSSLRR